MTKINQSPYDSRARVVSLISLEAMCEYISGVSHTFKVTMVTANRVRVEYSNPDEYGNPDPVAAVYPCFRYFQSQQDNPAVVLLAVNYIGCRGRNKEAWQAFYELETAPEMVRVGPDYKDWETLYQALVKRYPQHAYQSYWDKDGCIQTWKVLSTGEEFNGYRDAEKRSIELMRKEN